MAKKDGRFIIVLNLDRVLSVDEMLALGQSITPALTNSTESEHEH
jgi:hypothetical protein